MPFVFTKGTAIGVAENVIKGMMGAQHILEEEKGRSYLEGVRQWAAQKSVTAQRVLNTIDSYPHPIHVVAMIGGYTCFDNEPLPGGVIFIDVSINASVRTTGALGVHGKFERQHPFITFLHECGHAVQNIENPSQFLNSAKGPLSLLSADIATAARQRGDRIFSHIPYSERRVWFATNGPIIGQPWCVRLEYDNIYRHERPICIEAGEPMRDYYIDFRKN